MHICRLRGWAMNTSSYVPEAKAMSAALTRSCGAQRRADMAKTVAAQFAEILAAAGVKRVYGIVGDSLNGLTDALRRQAEIEWVHVRHEEVAAFAAGAE